MKYKDLIQFESVDEIIQFAQLDNESYRERLIKTFVFSESFEKDIIPRICYELNLDATYETKGLQVVGNYGTGKSHLMSLFSIIAEDESYLQYVTNQKAKNDLQKIAGRYKVIRFEISGRDSLWEMVTYQIDKYLEQWGIDYSIYDDKRPIPYNEKLESMMAAFEEAFPEKGLMIVIDEMLSYLTGHALPNLLADDLQVLQALGQISDRSRFRMVFGVQELIYQVPEFQFAAQMLGHVNERYTDIVIKKSDVEFIVQERLLHKDAHQKQAIKEHLEKFAKLFPDMRNHLDTFVNLYPVHPSYFDNFQNIRIGKSQREVLKVLSRRFATMFENDIPQNEPGLICYDSYWEDMKNSKDLMTIPNVRLVNQITTLLDQKIDEYFNDGLAARRPLAHRIVAASAIKILQDDITKLNGVEANSLANDLCFVDPYVKSYDELVELSIINTLDYIITITAGQYFDQNENNKEYHLRLDDTSNPKQEVINYANNMSDKIKDEYFYDFIAEIMPVDWNVYRPNFRIWDHAVTWKSHNIKLNGYIFMGNPNARSTTQPEQHFYMYFMPIFDKESAKHQPEDDGIFFLLDSLSDEFRENIARYGASQALLNSASTMEKPRYQLVKDDFFKKVRDLFNSEFMQCCSVEFKGQKRPLSAMNPHGDSKIDILSNVASDVLEDLFCQQLPQYPKFINLQCAITKDNRENLLKAARMTIVNPKLNNRNGEAILHALGLWSNGCLSTDQSQYAQSLKNKLEQRGGKVLNQSDILKLFYGEQYVSVDFNLEADLEFIVMAAMAQLGEIEIVLGDSTHINASNIEKINNLNNRDFYTFSHIAPPKGINIPLVRELSLGLLGQDRSGDLDNPQFYADLLVAAQELATKSVTILHQLNGSYSMAGVEILNPFDASILCNKLEALKGLCDKLRNYNTKAKLHNLPWTRDVIHDKLFTDKEELIKWDKLLKEIETFRSIINYLSEAKKYVADATLKQDIENGIEKLGVVITKDNTARNQYMRELESLKERYADYYLQAYLAAHLPASEKSVLLSIQDMEERQVAETVLQEVQTNANLSIINTYEYDCWKKKLKSVRIASPTVSKETILQTPYQNFNPVAEGHYALPNLKELKRDIVDILAGMGDQMKAALEDPTAQKNRQMLTDNESTLLDQFISGEVSLSSQYVQPILSILKKLSTDFNIEEITLDTLKTRFNRPLDVASAKEALSGIIDEIVTRQRQHGKKYEDIRIIIK